MKTMNITEHEFVMTFRPLRNHLDPNAAFDWGGGFGTMFETFGDELEFVRPSPSNHIWTFISADGHDAITSGYHIVNRVGYFISAEPVPNGLTVEVELDFC